jgi:hypothetical protein
MKSGEKFGIDLGSNEEITVPDGQNWLITTLWGSVGDGGGDGIKIAGTAIIGQNQTDFITKHMVVVSGDTIRAQAQYSSANAGIRGVKL